MTDTKNLGLQDLYDTIFFYFDERESIASPAEICSLIRSHFNLTPAQELRDKVASHEAELAAMKQRLAKHQSFKIISSCYGHVIDHGPLTHEKANLIQLRQNQLAQRRSDEGHDKAERDFVTAVPYKWLDTGELVFPGAWKTDDSFDVDHLINS